MATCSVILLEMKVKLVCVLAQDVMFFVNAPSAPWPRFGEMLSWQFLAATKLGLNADQLEMIAQKLFGKSCVLVLSQ